MLHSIENSIELILLKRNAHAHGKQALCLLTCALASLLMLVPGCGGDESKDVPKQTDQSGQPNQSNQQNTKSGIKPAVSNDLAAATANESARLILLANKSAKKRDFVKAISYAEEAVDVQFSIEPPMVFVFRLMGDLDAPEKIKTDMLDRRVRNKVVEDVVSSLKRHVRSEKLAYVDVAKAIDAAVAFKSEPDGENLKVTLTCDYHKLPWNSLDNWKTAERILHRFRQRYLELLQTTHEKRVLAEIAPLEAKKAANSAVVAKAMSDYSKFSSSMSGTANAVLKDEPAALDELKLLSDKRDEEIRKIEERRVATEKTLKILETKLADATDEKAKVVLRNKIRSSQKSLKRAPTSIEHQQQTKNRIDEIRKNYPQYHQKAVALKKAHGDAMALSFEIGRTIRNLKNTISTGPNVKIFTLSEPPRMSRITSNLCRELEKYRAARQKQFKGGR